MRRALILLIVGCLAGACGGDNGGSSEDAGSGSAPDGAASDGDVDPSAEASPAAGFWGVLCSVASTCGWLASCHPELGCNLAECDERHRGERDPSTLVAYLAPFEKCVREVAESDDCDRLTECYLPPAAQESFCDHAVRCGQASDRAECLDSVRTLSGLPKFDHMMPLYCIATLDSAAACSAVLECLKAGG